MPLPVDLATIIVTGDFPGGGGSPLQGTVTFTPSTDLTDSVGHVIIRAAPVEASLDYTGSLSQVLVCTDNADLSPSGWTWTVTERIVGLAVRAYSVLLPHTLGPTVDLSELVEVTPVTPPAGALLSQNNLADVASAPVSRGNLGLGTVATLSAPGGTTEFLRADLTWDVPAGGGGGVQIGGDLGGTNSAPLVISTSLTDPLPLAQGGTNAADAPGARTALGLGTAATQPSGAFDAAGAAAAALAAAESNAAATYLPLVGGALTGPLAMGAHKVTGVADGTVSTDGAAFGQVPAVGAAGSGAGNALSANDATTANARTPTAHASTHASGGTDPVTPAAIGAVATSAVGAAGGVASLDGSGHLTAAQGALLLVATNDLSDVPDKTAARGNLGLGGAAQLSVGTTSGTVAAGDDSRITGAAQKASNLSDLASAPTARTNLGLTGAATASLPLSIANGGTGSGTQSFVDLTTGQSITGVKAFASSPTGPTPTGASDLVPKSYADSIAQGLSVKASTRLATTAALPANVYANGASGVGATLTGVSLGALTVDGQTVNAGDRILVKDEAAAAANGIYAVTVAGAAGAAYVLTRATDMDQASEIPGAFAFTEAGTANTGAGFVVAGAGPYAIGTTAIAWTQFSGAGEITAGTGLAKSGNTISLSTPVALANGGTGQTGAAAAYNALSPMTTLGDLEYESGANTAARLAGNTTAARQFLTQTGNGTISAAPAWAAIAAGDVPTLNQNTSGTAANVSGTVAVGNGGTGATSAANARSSLGLPGSIPYSFDTPAQRGWAEWNFPPSVGVAVSQNFTTQVIYGISFIAQANSAITKAGVQVVSSAGTPVSGQNLIGLYSVSGTTATQIAVTGDLGTWSSAGFQSYAFGAGQTLVAGNTYLLLFMSNATTPVHLQGITSDTAAQIGFLNLGLSNTAAPFFKFFVNGTGQTALPGSFTIGLTTMSATNALAPWACLL